MKSFEAPNRILLQRTKIEKIIQGKPTPPSTVEIWPTWTCNYACLWCIYKSNHNLKYLSFDKIIEIINFCKSHDVSWVLLSGGGEPLLHPQIDQILDTLEKNEQKYILVTNGAFLPLHESHIQKMCKFLRISLDAGSDDVYSLVHDVSHGAFTKVIESIRKLRITKPWLRIGFTFVVNEYTIDNIHEFISIAEKFADEVLIREDVNASGKEVKNVKAEIESNDRIPIIWRNPIDSNKKTALYCYGSALKMLIDPDGNVPFCCRSTESLGNIYKKSLEDIWFSPRRLELLSKVDIKSCPPCRYSEANEIVEDFIFHDTFMDNL